MGVLACNRERCENIMCNRYSRELGYICDECFEDLCLLGPDANISDFMKSPKRFGKLRQASRVYFEAVFSDGKK